MGRNITMSETPLGRAPGGVPPEEMARRQVHDERGAGQGRAGAQGCLDRGIEPVTGPRRGTWSSQTGAVRLAATNRRPRASGSSGTELVRSCGGR